LAIECYFSPLLSSIGRQPFSLLFMPGVKDLPNQDNA